MRRGLCYYGDGLTIMADLTDEELQVLYTWIDEIPLSRQKKNITRDFSDGVMVAEVVQYYLPKLVELHNYSPANSTSQKLDNWRTVNRKIFSRLNFSLPDDILQDVAASKPGVVEFILSNLRGKIEKYLQNRTTMREQERRDSDDEFTAHQLYGGLYDPTQLSSNYVAGGPHIYNPQDHMRHPGPVQPPHEGTNFSHGQQYPPQHIQHHSQNPSEHSVLHHQSKIPLPNHHLSQIRQEVAKGKNSLSAAPLLPPLNTSTNGGRKGQPNPEKRPVIEKRNVYTYNLRHPSMPPPTNRNQPRKNSADVKLRLAEKDQRLLESQEYIQLLQMKVTRLEHLVQIKDLKIAELSRQLEFMQRHPLQKR